MNDLKMINDTFGHQAGDEALQLIGEQMKNSIRTSDAAARLGGDEFAIIYRHMGLEEGQKKIADLRTAFLELHLTSCNMSFSLAIGGASYPEETTDEDGLLKLADDRMYEHKRVLKQGRTSKNSL
jgi:diguanylate cyclase (GGDEF)-like protein